MLEVMETLDDDCDARGVHFVKVSSPEAHEAFGVQRPPKLLYFKHDDDDNAPNVFEGQPGRIRSTVFNVIEMNSR